MRALWLGLVLTLPWPLWAGSFCPQAPDGCVEVTGQASLDEKDTAYARQMALRDGLRNAVMRCQVQVRSQDQVRDFRLEGSTLNVRSAAAVKYFTILEETPDREAHLYKVRLRACLEPVSNQCGTPLAGGFQPRVAIGTVLVDHPDQVRDIRDLTQGWRRMLLRAFEQHGYRNVVPFDIPPALMRPQHVAPSLSPALLAEVREETGAQYLLLTVIRDAGAQRVPATHLQPALDEMLEEVRRSYTADLSPNRRSLTVEYFLIDLNHARIASQDLLRRLVEGEASVGRDKPFGGAAFMRTPTGRAMLEQVVAETEKVMKTLQCAPFEAEVLERRQDADGKTHILFFATPESGLKEGDQLAVYHRLAPTVRMGGQSLGTDRVPAGFIRVVRLQDRFAVAEIVAEKRRIEEGDLVRSW